MTRMNDPFVKTPNPTARGAQARFPAGRRSTLGGQIAAAFELACKNRDLEVAKGLLDAFEELTLRRQAFFTGVERNRLLEWLVGAHFRLLELRD